MPILSVIIPAYNIENYIKKVWIQYVCRMYQI